MKNKETLEEVLLQSSIDGEPIWGEPKQETLEEAAEKYALDKKFTTSRFIGFIDGAKWQQERSYSEEDMIATFHYGHQIGMNSILAIQSQHSPQPIPKPDLEVLKKEWFERLKKK